MVNNDFQTILKNGLIIALTLSAFGLISFFADLSQEQWVTYITYFVLIGGVAFFCNEFSKANSGNVTFGNIFGHGMKVSLAMTVFSLVFTFVMLAAFPEIKEKGIAQAMEKMEEQGQSEEQIEQAISFTENYFSLFMAFGVTIGYMFFGLIGSLVGGLVSKRVSNVNFE